MPLPDAEPTPNKANIYEQFSHIKVQDFTRDNLDVVRKPLNLNAEAEDVLRRILLVGLASNQLSSSGPLPGTVDVITFSASSSGSAVAKDQTGFYTEPGGVYEIYAPSISVGGGSGSIQHELRLIRDGRTVELLDFSTTGGSLRPTTEEGFIGGAIYVSHPAYLVYEASGTFTNSTMALAIVNTR
tara:strand:- start:262 stop:816 length:555 start_codon:yes stop_codon:yes gene_type:complete